VGRPNAASAFVQLLWPWLGTARSTDLPEHLEPAEGLFAGVLAANALGRGTFRSVAGTPLPSVARLEPVPDLGLGADSPTARLAERVCLIGPEPDGVYVLSDVTSSPDRAWRSGGVSRLMSALLRAARRTGETHLFDPNGPELWARVRGSLENLLDGFYSAGALGGKSRAEAFTVRCDLSTMSQNDLDNGRLRAEITVLPASAIARITVSLELGAGGAETRLPEVA
jgi:phage tail sheath protein FI